MGRSNLWSVSRRSSPLDVNRLLFYPSMLPMGAGNNSYIIADVSHSCTFGNSIGHSVAAYICATFTFLRSQPTIQKFITASLLFLSLVSFLPKAYFHEALANHKDGVNCPHNGEQTPCVHTQGYNCSFTDLVVTSPYEPAAINVCLVKPLLYSSFNNCFYTPLLSQTFFSAESRGPPAFAA